MMTMVVTDNNFVASFDDLSDVLPNILGFLSLQDIMCNRRINKKTREAVTNTIVPLTEFCVYSVENYVTMGLPNLQQIRYNAMRVMTTVLPNLQQITIGYLGHGHKFSDGEDPDEEYAAETANRISVDIGIISNFSKLRVLDIRSSYCQLGYADPNSIQCSSLNGRYPVFFNSFPLLQKLTIKHCHYLKWNLEMLAGFPLLKELECGNNTRLTGSINSLRVLRDTLEKVTIEHCENAEGNFMDLADFPHLKKLSLFVTAVTGDIRDIGDNDFTNLEHLDLSHLVYGGKGYEFQHISDGPDIIRAVYLLKQRPALKYHWYGQLSQASLDWYESVEDFIRPPFNIRLVQAGTRVGYAWGTPGIFSCEVNWLDPEPDRDSSGYEQYIEGLQKILISPDYRGFHQPPTEEEYHRLYQESLGGN
jgi:hypothetical protein